MAETEEKVPLLESSNPQTSNLFPPTTNINYSHNGHSAPSYYGIIEVPLNEGVIQFETRQIRRNQTTRIAGSPFPAIIAAAAGIILISTLALTLIPHGETRVNLQAAAPPTSYSKPHLSQSSPQSFVDIEIPHGQLRGYKKLSRDGREYLAFFKVPYAAPPIGSLRFKDPVPPSPWSGLRDFSEVAPQCIQKEKYVATPTTAGDEDCLYANVYTPRLPNNLGEPSEDTNKLFPVMVNLHGGGFDNGNGSRYGADYFMDEDVVIITFEFRLGALGFLSTGDDVIRGNMGQKDQVQMLKWVRDNAKYFNGNPDLVTIFGNSGGGIFTCELLLSPMARGLYHRAISQSGTSIFGFGPDIVFEDLAKYTMNQVGRAMNCSTEDSQKYRDCLLEKSAEEFIFIDGAVYAFTLEHWEGGDDSTQFLSERPLKLLEAGSFHPVPLMIGNVNAEYHVDGFEILQDKDLTLQANEHFETLAPQLTKNLTEDEMNMVKKFYFGDKKIDNSTFMSFGELFSDARIVHSSYATARYHAEQANAYLYWLTKPPYKSYMERTMPGFPMKELGLVNHADELQYLFPYYDYPYIPKDDPEYYKFSKYLVKLWVHFAKTGNPTMDGIEWRPVNGFGDGDANSTYWLELNDNPALTTVLQERMGFWDQFGQP